MNKKSIFTILAILLITGCAGSKYSYVHKGETVQMKVEEDSEHLAFHRLRSQEIPTLAARGESARGFALIGQAFSFAMQGMTRLIQADRAKYSAEYDQHIKGLYFYDQISSKGHFDPTGMQFKGFTVRRMAQIKGRDTLAFKASFEVDTLNMYEIINSSVFRLKLTDFSLHFAKAKSPATKWYAPWSWGNKAINDRLNMDLEVRFFTSYVTRDGLLHEDVQVGLFTMNLRNLPLNPATPGYDEFSASLKGRPLIGESFIIPRSFGYSVAHTGQLQESYGQGKYRIEVSVKENGSEKFLKRILSEYSNEIMDQGGGRLMEIIAP